MIFRYTASDFDHVLCVSEKGENFGSFVDRVILDHVSPVDEGDIAIWHGPKLIAILRSRESGGDIVRLDPDTREIQVQVGTE